MAATKEPDQGPRDEGWLREPKLYLARLSPRSLRDSAPPKRALRRPRTAKTFDSENERFDSENEETGKRKRTVQMSEASSEQVLIDVEGLTKHYGEIRAVDGITFQVRRGDILGFLGPNGAGKTTAMKMITGFLEPDAGSVRVAGLDMSTDSLEARQRLGYLPENAPAYGEMTVRDFLDFVAKVRELPNRNQATDRVIGMTELGGVVDQTIETLSKGFKRRVGLAQALIHDPEVLILDEPTDGLDPNQKAMCRT